MYASNLHKMPAPSHLSAAPVVTPSPPGFRRLVPPALRLPLLLTVCPSCSPFAPPANRFPHQLGSFRTLTLHSTLELWKGIGAGETDCVQGNPFSGSHSIICCNTGCDLFTMLAAVRLNVLIMKPNDPT